MHLVTSDASTGRARRYSRHRQRAPERRHSLARATGVDDLMSARTRDHPRLR